MKTKLLELFIAIPLLAISGLSPAAAATYNYTGLLFTTTFGTYTQSDRVTGSVTFAAPLAPSIGTILIPVSETPTAFSFSDGVQTITNLSVFGTPVFQFTTDATGAIIRWNVDIFSNTTNNIETYYYASQDQDDGHNQQGPILAYGVIVDPLYGVWTSASSTTPLPTALPLFATGLGALGLLGWRRKRKNAAIAA